MVKHVLERPASALFGRRGEYEMLHGPAKNRTDRAGGLNRIRLRAGSLGCLAKFAAMKVIDALTMCDSEQPSRKRPAVIEGFKPLTGLE
jgi:hypothetical protein